MKCEKCGNDYPSNYYFATPTICHECFKKLSAVEQNALLSQVLNLTTEGEFSGRKGFGVRLGARLLDYLIFSGVILVISASTGIMTDFVEFYTKMFQNLSDSQYIQQISLAFNAKHRMTFIGFNILTLLYYSLEIFGATSLGRMILGLKIGDNDGKKAGISNLTIRYLLKQLPEILSILILLTNIAFLSYISLIITLALFVGCFFVLAEKKQSFHDLLAGTAVYNSNDIS
jgi:uncharacterized RDD family membrane protein YckC